VNRVNDGAAGENVDDDLAALLGEGLGRKVARNAEDTRRLAEHDAAQIARLERELRGEPLITVPLLDDDVYDVDGLAAINEHLFAADAVASASR